jgi:hypothetical protein
MRREARAVRSRAARVWLTALSLAAVGCEPSLTSVGAWTDSGHYLEAEDGVLSGGFQVGVDSAASAGRYLAPPFGVNFSDNVVGTARAVYEFSLRTPGTYHIFGRIRSPTTSSNRFWFQVDDGAWTKWRITTGDIWYWDTFHVDENYGMPVKFELTAGPHQLLIANCVDNAQLDRLYFSTNPARPEPKGTACDPPNYIDLDGGCAPSCGSLSGLCHSCPVPTSPAKATYDCPSCCLMGP